MSTAVLPTSSVNSPRTELRALARLAVPIAIAQGGQALMGLVDTLVVGRAGTSALAAVGLGNGLYFAVSSFGMGLMMGFDPMISQAIGARQFTRARALLWQGAWMAFCAGVMLATLMALAPRLLPLAGISETEAAGASQYLMWRAPGMPMMLMFLTMRSYLQATAFTRPLVIATVVANIFNLLGNLVLVFGGANLPAWFGPLRSVPALGVAGSAMATSASIGIELLIAVLFIRSRKVEGARASRLPVWADLSRAIRLGLPIGLHICAEVGVFALAGVLAAGLGPASVGAHQIAISFASVSFTVAMGIGNAGSVRVGWAVGAHNTPQARLSGFMALAGGAGFMALSGLVFALFPHTLAKLAGAPADVLPLLIPLLMVSAIFQVFDGAQGVGAGVLRGAGDTRFTFLANMVGHYAIGLPVTLLLAFKLGLGVVGIWWGLCAGLISVAVALVWRFNRMSAGTLRPVEA
ncbi:putative multidrug resistance protein NorM [Myxococcus xanthus DK 1622]|uniref:Multidrug-efflux transporter n=1 Tax=Myxococcus xanthus (strain DK1622) TaxID=246197 RepID=Q1CWT8_MYXXD|nr:MULTISPECIES: MATE family efflux transporter [Myxococcus]ABF87208.1 putative multidrug resistance protein NorM [Myxococcus xanthus DK 1622]NOJ52812.1 MATE family efflux transporter [Myxococcus xanthus]QPM79300.1 MATE family efflux transporter [Myxococcus xanthus]QVW68379.1 MATE family efflux transporter [Myxococcus xanthus DZ2]QZZ54628.1 Multidrug resistance protein MdtK [Myxococcus xanthus]